MSAPLTLRRWQGEAIPVALAGLEAGEAGIVQATTGAGKSIFLAELLRRWRLVHPPAEGLVVVTTPTRKLTEQLGKTFRDILGGHVVGLYYTRAKQDRREVIVCCNASVPALAARLAATGRKVALWIADECHRTETEGVKGVETGPSADELAGLLRAERLGGLTATPFRSREGDTLTLYTHTWYTYPPAQALRDGVIVHTRYVLPDTDDVEVDTWTADEILKLGDRATRGPGAVDAESIADAESYVGHLAGRGIVARSMHSKQAPEVQADTLRALEAGEIDCVVHVSMLVEGVDLPWLRWLAVRRKTGSRIRWIQQVGRVIRAFVGKREAVVIDPHAQSMDYSPTYAAALGWPDPEAEETARRELVEREAREATDEEATPEARHVARVGAVCRYLRALRNAIAAEGVSLDTRRERGTRYDAATERQLAQIQRMRRIVHGIGEPHGSEVGRLAAAPWILTLGSASDAIDLLAGVSAWARRHPDGALWSPAAPVPLPPEVVHEAGARPSVVYVAGAIRGQRVAGVVVRDGREVLCKVRNKKPGDHVQAVTTSLVEWATAGGATSIRTSNAIVARSMGLTHGVQYVEDKDNPALRKAWSAIVREEKRAAESAAQLAPDGGDAEEVLRAAWAAIRVGGV